MYKLVKYFNKSIQSKDNKRLYLQKLVSYVSQSNRADCKDFIKVIKFHILNSEIPLKFESLRILCICMRQKNNALAKQVITRLYSLLQKHATFKCNRTSMNRGKDLFKHEVRNQADVLYSVKYLQLLLYSISEWVCTYGQNDELSWYYDLYNNLIELEVKFPTRQLEIEIQSWMEIEEQTEDDFDIQKILDECTRLQVVNDQAESNQIIDYLIQKQGEIQAFIDKNYSVGEEGYQQYTNLFNANQLITNTMERIFLSELDQFGAENGIDEFSQEEVLLKQQCEIFPLLIPQNYEKFVTKDEPKPKSYPEDFNIQEDNEEIQVDQQLLNEFKEKNVIFSQKNKEVVDQSQWFEFYIWLEKADIKQDYKKFIMEAFKNKQSQCDQQAVLYQNSQLETQNILKQCKELEQYKDQYKVLLKKYEALINSNNKLLQDYKVLSNQQNILMPPLLVDSVDKTKLESWILQAYKYFDINNDELVSKDNLLEGLGIIDKIVTRPKILSIIEVIDLSENNSITYSDFLTKILDQ